MSKKGEKMSRFRKTVTFQALLLGGAAAIATTLLGTGDIRTRDAIAQRAKEDLKESIGQVIPAKLHDNDLLESRVTLEREDGTPVQVYRATRNGVLTALAFGFSGIGYGGKITGIMAVKPSGEILGVRILSHSETPGLGDRIELKKDDWILGFNGRSLGDPPKSEWAVKKDGGYFDQFSGATITPRAVVKAVKSGLEFYGDRRAELSKPDESSSKAVELTRAEKTTEEKVEVQ